VAIINPRFVKPLDLGMTEFFGRAADAVVTFEDHVAMGGYGSAVLEFFNEKRITTPVIQIAWPDQFIEHGTNVEDLRNKYGLTVDNAVAKVRSEFGTTTLVTEKESRAQFLTL
jgi:1-deoxy-D-xylulose-5-phosphate synthase